MLLLCQYSSPISLEMYLEGHGAFPISSASPPSFCIATIILLDLMHPF